MLSLSIDAAGSAIDFGGLLDPDCKEIPGIPCSAALIQFVDAFMSRDSDRLNAARESLLDAVGVAAMVDTVGVASNFQRMVRIADATAIPPVNMGQDELAAELNDQLGLNDLNSAVNARAPG